MAEGKARKALVKAEIEDEEKGTATIVFATFNKVDSDKDVTNPGAFEDGASVPVSAYGHTSWEGKLPVGVADLKSSSTEARASLQFFMDTKDGADTFRVVKRLAAKGLGEWSYGYTPLEYSFGEFGTPPQPVRFLDSVKVHEVSPVLQGAGVGTRTVDAKSGTGGNTEGVAVKGIVLGPHETDVNDRPWDPTAVTNGLGLAVTVEQLRAMHAWYDTTSDPGHKAAYRFMHHHGPGGPASVRACLLGIAALNGAKGDSVAPEVKAGVYAHLAGHLVDADRQAPELRPDGGQLKLNDALLVVLADVQDVIAQTSEVGASRHMRGRKLTKSTMDILQWLDEALADVRLLYTTDDEQAAQQYAQYIALTGGWLKPTEG